MPDRRKALCPRVLDVFHDAGVSCILHAGDVSSPSVLKELEQVAPVRAVRGNRDWVLLNQLPRTLILSFEGLRVVLDHGHGSWRQYVSDRLYYLRYGCLPGHFHDRLRSAFPSADVIVFGHTHIPLNQWVNGQLLFNPGSPHFPESRKLFPSVGLLHFRGGKRVEGKIIKLE